MKSTQANPPRRQKMSDETPLHDACMSNDLDTVQQLLADGSEVDKVDSSGRTPIWLALTSGHFEIADLLLKNGASLEVKDSDGNTVLHDICKAGEKEAFNFLIENNADVNSKNKDGLTPLYGACTARDLDMVRTLLEKGADINVISESDEITPLHVACEYNAVEIVKHLIENDSMLDVPDVNGDTPAMKACVPKLEDDLESSVEIVKLLLEQDIDFRHCNNQDYTLLHKAAPKCSVELLKLILSYGTDKNAFTREDNTALHLACKSQHWDAVKFLFDMNVVLFDENIHGERPETFALRHGNLEIVKMFMEKETDVSHLLAEACVSENIELITYLIENGADLDARVRDNLLPIHTAATHGNADILELLLEKGNDVNATTTYLETPLHVILKEEGQADGVKLLLDREADVAALDYEGRSPLHFAVQSLDNVNLLLEKAVDVNVCDKNGETALHRACKCSNRDVVEALIAAGADINLEGPKKKAVLHYAAENGDVEVMRYLLEESGADLDINSMSEEHGSPIHHASQYNLTGLVEYLLDKEVDVNLLNNKGETPLVRSLASGSVGVAKLLLTKGADTNMADVEGVLPIHYACRRKHADFEVIDMLLEQGADLSTADQNGCTSLLHACGYSDLKVVKKLLETGAEKVVDNEGKNALHHAAFNGDMDLVTFIYQNDYKLNCPDEKGFHPLGYCRNWETADLLFSLTPSVKPEEMDNVMLCPSYDENTDDIMERLLQGGANANLVDDHLNTPMHYAALAGNVFAIRHLYDHGAEVDPVNDVGQTPIFNAYKSNTFDAVRLLLYFKADHEHVDNLGRKPLDIGKAHRPVYVKYYELRGTA